MEPPVKTIAHGPDETISELLPRRERELIRQIVVLRGRLAPLENELNEVRKAMEAIGLPRSYAEELKPFLENPTEPPNILEMDNVLSEQNILGVAAPTIKQMILAALRSHFHKGATPTELREYIKTAYDRDVDRNSISPQLARLRDDKLVEQYGFGDGKWKLTRGARWYDKSDPESVKQDEPADDPARDPNKPRRGRLI
jgi:hypothetical protein